MTLEVAHEYLKGYRFNLAFEAFKEIAGNESHDSITRSEAYNMMGVIVNGFLVLPDDEVGLEYFRRALELDPNAIGVLLNIVNTFGVGPSMHLDEPLFKRVYDRLLEDFVSEIPVDELILIKKKYAEFYVGGQP